MHTAQRPSAIESGVSRRRRRKLGWLLAALVVVFFAAESIYAYNRHCKNPANAAADTLACVMVTDVVLLTGGATLAVDAIANRVTPRTDVLVQLPDGTQLRGQLARQALGGRTLVEGKPLKLNCRVTQPARDDEHHAVCQLGFPDLAPRPKAIDYYEKTGKQPGWWFNANRQGVPDPGFMTLERPLRWVDGQGR
jgi:hypothetical protein